VVVIASTERRCARCGHVIPREAVTNRRMAELASRPEAAAMVAEAIWPAEAPAARGVPTLFAACPTGADWVLSGLAGGLVCQAEHKPWGTPAQWSWATAGEYRCAIDKRVIIGPGPGLLTAPDGTHEGPHHGKAWTGDCWSCKKVPGTSGRLVRLALPQVVLYSVRASLPCTLITDQGPDASSVYSTGPTATEPGFTINPASVPVRTVAEVLNSLAARAARVSGGDRDLLRDIATRLWWRSPWNAVSTLSGSANELITESAQRHWRDCAGRDN
jgi:hypothetical protein